MSNNNHPQPQDAEPTPEESRTRGLPVEELGMTQDEALALRASFGSLAEDWDDPAMDVYDDRRLDLRAG